MEITTITPATNTPNNSYVYATVFSFTDETTGNVVNRTWDLGDGTTIYSQKTVNYTYNYPGTYLVSLTSFQSNGTLYVASTSIDVDYFYRDAIVFLSRPDNFSVPGIVTPQTFKIAVTSANIEPVLYVDLYAINSRSLPYTFVPKKWEFLTPTWRFTDVNENVIETLPVSTTNLYYGNTIVGVSGEAEFYYIDDTSTGDNTECPLVLTITLQTSGFSFPLESNTYKYPSYANNRTAEDTIYPVGAINKGIIWKVYNVQPTVLDVTENYISDVYPIKWSTVKIPVLISVHGTRYNKIKDIVEKTGILFSYPENNGQGFESPINITLSGVPSTYYTVDVPVYFQAFDENNDPTGGYIYTTITPLSPIPETQIQATGTFFIDPNDDPELYMWVSNPVHNQVLRVNVSPYDPALLEQCDTIYDYIEDDALLDGQIYAFDVPSISSTSNFNYYMSGFSGIYGFAPIPPERVVYATDAELEKIYKFDIEGNLLVSFSLSSIDGYSNEFAAYTPSNISVDQNLNVYVSLFNSVSVLKFDKDLNLLNSILIPSPSPYGVFDGDFLAKPPTLETDRENNLWVTYAHPLSNFLVYFNFNTNSTVTIQLQPYSVPTSISVDLDNNVWVAQSYNVSNRVGTLQKYSPEGILLQEQDTFYRPGYTFIDYNNNLWFSNGINYFGYLDTTSFAQYNFYFGENNTLSAINPDDTSLLPSLQDDEDTGGLAIDYYNRVCFINSKTNTLFVIPVTASSAGTQPRIVPLLPRSIIGYVKDVDNTFTYTVSSEYFKSAQANGDWTGTKWLLKYTPQLSALEVVGSSTPFTVYNYDSPPGIRKLNENFNASEHLKSLALPEILSNNSNFFDRFLGPIAGTSMPSAYQDIGQTIYEKIANFTINHTDVDTCGIEQLISLARQVNISANYSDISYPAELLSLLDVVSIPRSKLWGLKSPIPVTGTDIFGKELDVSTTTLTAGTQIVLQNRFQNANYFVINVPIRTIPVTFKNVTCPDCIPVLPVISRFTSSINGPSAYNSFNNQNYSRYIYEGNNIALFVPEDHLSNSTEAERLFSLVLGLDKIYQYYKALTGKDPDPGKTFNNKTIIAGDIITCGYSCANLGEKGIEFNSTGWLSVSSLAMNGQYDTALAYEFGRNFWHDEYTSRLRYKSPDSDVVITGFAAFNRITSYFNTGLQPQVAFLNGVPFNTYVQATRNLLYDYVNNSFFNWENTLRQGLTIPNEFSLGSTDLFASFCLDLSARFGCKFVDNIWKIAGNLPPANTTQDAVDNFIIASCSACCANLIPLFDYYKWPISSTATTLITDIDYPIYSVFTSTFFYDTQNEIKENIYPLSALELPGVIKPISANYICYEYTPTYSDTFIENVIDWDNPYTTISSSVSTAQQWYGSQGIIEQTINHLLTKKLLSK